MAYRADIEIGVKGIGQLGALQKSLNQVSNTVDIFNKKQAAEGFKIQNLQTYNQLLQKATENIYKAAAGSKEELEAIKDLVQIKNLQAAAQQRINSLLAKEDAHTASIVRQQEELLSIAARGRLAAASEARRTAPVEVQRTPTAGVAYPLGAGPGEGPAAQAAVEQSVVNRVQRVAELQKEYEQEIFRIKRDFDIKAHQTELQFIQAELNAELDKIETAAAAQRKADAAALKDFDARLQGRTEAKGRQKEALSNAVIGGAFPLLFGQGMGAALGGGLGGAAGGMMGGQFGFGLSLVGTAIGQQLDTASKTASDFAKSLKEGGDAAGFLKANISGVRPETLNLISNLQQSGQTARAAKVAFDELAKAIGKENAQALQTAGENANKYKGIIDRLGLAFIAAGYRANEFFDRIARNPLNVDKTFTEKSLENLFPGAGGSTKEQTQAADQRVKMLSKETDILKTQAVLGTLSAKNNLDKYIIYTKLAATQEYIKTLADIEYKLKTGTVSKAERLLLVEQARGQLQVDLNNAERQRVEELRRRQEDAQRLAEQAAQKQAAATKARFTIFKEALELEVQIGQQYIKREEFTKGEVAGLNMQLKLSNTIREYRLAALDAERKIAVEEAKTTGTVKETNALFERRKQLLQDQQLLEEQQAAARKLTIRLEKKQEIRDAAKPITDFLQQQILQNNLTREYNKLISEGVLPAEAERIAKFYEIVEQQQLQLNNQIKNVEQQIMLAEASTIEAEAKGAVVNKLKEELDLLKKKSKAVQDAGAQGPGKGKTNAERLEDAIASSRGELLKLADPINQVISGANAIGNAFRDAFSGLVSGAMTGQEALAAFFKGVGDHFLDMASMMIAKLIEIWILETVLGMVSGRVSSTEFVGAGKGAGGTNAWAYAPGLPKFAEGGVVTRPTMGLIGEGGEPEYVIPASKMRGAMNRYAAGARGSAVIPTGSESGDGMTATMAAPGAIDVRYTVERINSVDYVTADQFQRGMQQAAAQGAAQGEQRTLRRLQSSNSTRKRLGI